MAKTWALVVLVACVLLVCACEPSVHNLDRPLPGVPTIGATSPPAGVSALGTLTPAQIPSPSTVVVTDTFVPTSTASPRSSSVPTQPITYVVQAGDTLGRLARRFSTTIEDITEVNTITDVDLIDTGQVLVLPKGARTPSPMTPTAKASLAAMMTASGKPQARPAEPMATAPPSVAGVSPEYSGSGANHWVAKNIASGRFIALEDNSLWEIAPTDTIHALLWLPTGGVVVAASPWALYPYTLVNTLQGGAAQAKYLGPIVVSSRINGTFTGWEGDTAFALSNGQVWQQASYAYCYHYAYWPEVLIVQTSGGCKMVVEGVEGSIYVKRLK